MTIMRYNQVHIVFIILNIGLQKYPLTINEIPTTDSHEVCYICYIIKCHSYIYLQTPSVPLYADVKEVNNRPKAPPNVQADVMYSKIVF